MTSLRRSVLVMSALVALVGCDHVTKLAAKAELETHAPRPLITSVLDLRYTENTDVAFNLLRWVSAPVRGPLLLVFGVIAILAVAGVLLRWRGSEVSRVALVFVLAGALGNYLDRAFRGYVIDFIHVPHWPVFNVADIWVTGGIALLLVANLRAPPRARVT